MSKVLQRLLTFFIGVPLVIGIIMFKPYNHLLLNIVITTFALLSSIELHNMLSTQSKLFPKWLTCFFVLLFPILCWVFTSLNIDMILTIWVFVFEIIILMGIECFTQKTFEDSAKKISFTTLILFYVGFMPTLISYITYIPNKSTQYLIMFFTIVFMTDSFAWLFGVLFGKNNQGIIAASPKKSVAGFIGGVLATLLCSLLFKVIFPECVEGPVYKLLILTFMTCCGAIIGDLIESVIKRSCNIKDSGNLIPGRGGVLDSIDSIIIAGPVFYLFLYFFYLV